MSSLRIIKFITWNYFLSILNNILILFIYFIINQNIEDIISLDALIFYSTVACLGTISFTIDYRLEY